MSSSKLAEEYGIRQKTIWEFKRKMQLALNSQKGFVGIARKMYMLVIVAVAHRVDLILGMSGACVVATWFYIGNEGLSIVENAAKAGVPIPEAIKESLEQLAREKKAREKRGN